MKKTLIICFIICLFTFLGVNLFKKNENRNHRPGKIVNSFIGHAAQVLKEKYKLNTMAIKTGMPGGVVEELGIYFQKIDPLSRENAREILINISKDFLNLINGDEKIRPFLKNYPFKIQNVTIKIFFYDSRMCILRDPFIGIASISEGELSYRSTIEKDDISVTKSMFNETYEEALEAIRNEGQASNEGQAWKYGS